MGTRIRSNIVKLKKYTWFYKETPPKQRENPLDYRSNRHFDYDSGITKMISPRLQPLWHKFGGSLYFSYTFLEWKACLDTIQMPVDASIHRISLHTKVPPKVHASIFSQFKGQS